jgi:calcium/calmodulin-dependent serine protein kinase
MPMLAHGPSMTSLHGPLPPPPLCNPCSQQPNNFNSVPLPGPSRWGPRTSCPVHSPFRARIPNGTICSGHQVMTKEKRINFLFIYCSVD